MHSASCLARESRQGPGVIAGAALEVPQALLWGFHGLLLSSVRAHCIL